MKVKQKFKSNNNIVYSCTYHVIWVVKYRRKFLTGKIETRLKQICREVAKENGFKIQEAECDQDHIHLLIDIDPQFGIHKAVKRLKGRSSRLLRQEFGILRSRLPTLWTNSYFVATCGGAPLSVIKQYIESQKLRES
jgi:putative transposase